MIRAAVPRGLGFTVEVRTTRSGATRRTPSSRGRFSCGNAPTATSKFARPAPPHAFITSAATQTRVAASNRLRQHATTIPTGRAARPITATEFSHGTDLFRPVPWFRVPVLTATNWRQCLRPEARRVRRSRITDARNPARRADPTVHRPDRGGASGFRPRQAVGRCRVRPFARSRANATDPRRRCGAAVVAYVAAPTTQRHDSSCGALRCPAVVGNPSLRAHCLGLK